MPNQFDLSQVPATFSQFIQPQADAQLPVQAMQGVQQLGQPSGYMGKTGQVAYFLDSFMKGAAAGKARSAALNEYRQYKDYSRLSQLLKMTEQPGLDPEAAKNAQMQILKVMGGHAVDTASEAGKHNPLMAGLAKIGEAFLGGPGTKYSPVPEKGGKNKKGEDQVGFDQLFDAVRSIPRTSDMATTEYAAYDKARTQAISDFQQKNGYAPSQQDLIALMPKQIPVMSPAGGGPQLMDTSMLRSRLENKYGYNVNQSDKEVTLTAGQQIEDRAQSIADRMAGISPQQQGAPAPTAENYFNLPWIQGSQVQAAAPDQSGRVSVNDVAYLKGSKTQKGRVKDQYGYYYQGKPSAVLYFDDRPYVNGGDGYYYPANPGDIKSNQQMSRELQADLARTREKRLDAGLNLARQRNDRQQIQAYEGQQLRFQQLHASIQNHLDSLAQWKTTQENRIWQNYSSNASFGVPGADTIRNQALQKINETYESEAKGLLNLEQERELSKPIPEISINEDGHVKIEEPPEDTGSGSPAPPDTRPISIRNNNPLAVGINDGKGKSYGSWAEGWYNNMADLQKAITSKGANGTILDLTKQWAPKEASKLNNPEAYADAVAKRLNLPGGGATKLSEIQGRLPELAQAMAEVEAGEEGRDYLAKNPAPGFTGFKTAAPPVEEDSHHILLK